MDYIGGGEHMKLDYFRDKLFDLLNDNDLEIADLNADERNKRLVVSTEDGTVFEIIYRLVSPAD